MGDAADMILDGFVDEHTGEYIDGRGYGYPRSLHRTTTVDYKKEALRVFPLLPGNPGNISFIQIDLYIKEFCIKGLKLPENIGMKACYRYASQNSEAMKTYLKTHHSDSF